MSLIRRKPTGLKKISIGGKEFYSSASAAQLLGFSKSKLTKGLKSKRYVFQTATLEDIPNAAIFVSVADVEIFLRQRSLQLNRRLENEFAGAV